ncbi:MAG: hypothetical protein ACI845_002058 [Gammaproteobacteria bacterium]|jgi:hypothetical protein
MKIFFALLLIANIAFGFVQWLLPQDQLSTRTPNLPVAETLVLLPENRPTVQAENVSTSSDSEPKDAELIVEDQGDLELCYTIGPFRDKKRALEISGRYQSKTIKTDLKSVKDREYLGVMVYLDGHKNREAAVATAEKLGSQGIRDYIIVNEEGKSNVLSLGVFGLKKNAEARIKRLRELNYNARSEARYRQRTIYWLYNQQPSTSEALVLIDEKDSEKGISQIPAQCG